MENRVQHDLAVRDQGHFVFQGAEGPLELPRVDLLGQLRAEEHRVPALGQEHFDQAVRVVGIVRGGPGCDRLRGWLGRGREPKKGDSPVAR
jgi:hypothetical protein